MKISKFKNRIRLRDGKLIGDNCQPYFVAELNTSHFGNIKLAKKMIYEAKKSGCNCIKLQSWTPESLYSEKYYKKNPISKKFFKEYSLTNKNLKDLSDYCHSLKISFSSTPYSFEEVDFLVNKCKPAFIKVASMDLNNHLFLQYIAKKKLPIVLSTGMGDVKEILDAVKIIKNSGNNNVCILHCVSLYPVEAELINLRNIIFLKKKLKQPIGFSDHSIGSSLAISSIPLGACLIEKHFTLDKKKIGMDNNMATEPTEMRQLIKDCKNSFMALGSFRRSLSKKELRQRLIMRRSIFAKKLIKKGSKLNINNLEFKRPGNGLSPNKLKLILGKKAKINIELGTLIKRKFLD